MCYTDFDCELGMASGGVHIFPTKEDCATCRPCTDQCGIVKVTITGMHVVQQPIGFNQIDDEL